MDRCLVGVSALKDLVGIASFEAFTAMLAIVRGHLAGTRFGIRVDPEDGLVWRFEKPR